MTQYEILSRKVDSLNDAARRCRKSDKIPMYLMWTEKAIHLWVTMMDLTVEEASRE